jgi:hypothetical protein
LAEIGEFFILDWLIPLNMWVLVSKSFAKIHPRINGKRKCPVRKLYTGDVKTESRSPFDLLDLFNCTLSRFDLSTASNGDSALNCPAD